MGFQDYMIQKVDNGAIRRQLAQHNLPQYKINEYVKLMNLERSVLISLRNLERYGYSIKGPGKAILNNAAKLRYSIITENQSKTDKTILECIDNLLIETTVKQVQEHKLEGFEFKQRKSLSHLLFQLKNKRRKWTNSDIKFTSFLLGNNIDFNKPIPNNIKANLTRLHKAHSQLQQAILINQEREERNT